MTSIVIIAVAVFVGVLVIGALIKKAPSQSLKYVNRGVSAAAFISGLASYVTGVKAYFYIFLACLVAYFLTINLGSESK